MSLDRRASYRIIYPAQARPRLQMDDGVRAVSDVSEHGLRFEDFGDGSVVLGDDFEGVVRFQSGAELKVVGTVVRIAEGWVAVRLDDRLPLATILAEQRLLRSRYPTWGREIEA